MNQAKDMVLSFKVRAVRGLSSQEVDEMIRSVKLRHAEHAPAKPSRFKFWRGTGLGIAAMLLIFGLAGWFFSREDAAVFYQSNPSARNPYHEVVNRSSRNMLLKLGDGSVVILNPLARLKYPRNFLDKKREVWLSGEAFFEISKNAKRPFFVYSNELTVAVLGTSFSVRAGQKDNLYQVKVSTGKVAVCARKSNGEKTKDWQSVMLDPNQQATFDRDKFLLKKKNLVEPLLLSKKSTRIHFQFEKAPFSKVVAALQDAYGVNVIYNKAVMEGCLLTASLTDMRLEERLDLICKAIEAQYTIKGGEITISGKGCD
jgi:ferric-dicitrate binding protein FerR (iron transport regulator)